MKKSNILILLILAGMILTNCSPQKKITYLLPPTYTEAQKTQLLVDIDKGKILYKEYCMGCHGIFKKGKDSIPDFSKQQINLYAQRFLYSDPKNHAFVMEIGGDQLTQIISFLRYRATKGLKADTSGRKM